MFNQHLPGEPTAMWHFFRWCLSWLTALPPMKTWHSRPSMAQPIAMSTEWICTAISRVGAKTRTWEMRAKKDLNVLENKNRCSDPDGSDCLSFSRCCVLPTPGGKTHPQLMRFRALKHSSTFIYSLETELIKSIWLKTICWWSKLSSAIHFQCVLFYFSVNLLTCVAGFSKTRESKAMVQNTHVFPVPDLACTIKSERENREIWWSETQLWTVKTKCSRVTLNYLCAAL